MRGNAWQCVECSQWNISAYTCEHCRKQTEAISRKSDVVNLLRKWLEYAESGTLSEVLIAGVAILPPDGPGGVSTEWAGIAPGYVSLGAATVLQTRIANACAQNT